TGIANQCYVLPGTRFLAIGAEANTRAVTDQRCYGAGTVTCVEGETGSRGRQHLQGRWRLPVAVRSMPRRTDQPGTTRRPAPNGRWPTVTRAVWRWSDGEWHRTAGVARRAARRAARALRQS